MHFQPGDRAARLPQLDIFTRAVGEVAHALGVGAGAVGFAFEQGGAFAVAGTLHGIARDGFHGEHIVAIHFDAGDAIRRATRCHAGIARDC